MTSSSLPLTVPVTDDVLRALEMKLAVAIGDVPSIITSSTPITVNVNEVADTLTKLSRRASGGAKAAPRRSPSAELLSSSFQEVSSMIQVAPTPVIAMQMVFPNSPKRRRSRDGNNSRSHSPIDQLASCSTPPSSSSSPSSPLLSIKRSNSGHRRAIPSATWHSLPHHIDGPDYDYPHIHKKQTLSTSPLSTSSPYMSSPPSLPTSLAATTSTCMELAARAMIRGIKEPAIPIWNEAIMAR
jgi:hypothetical protein